MRSRESHPRLQERSCGCCPAGRVQVGQTCCPSLAAETGHRGVAPERGCRDPLFGCTLGPVHPWGGLLLRGCWEPANSVSMRHRPLAPLSPPARILLLLSDKPILYFTPSPLLQLMDMDYMVEWEAPPLVTGKNKLESCGACKSGEVLLQHELLQSRTQNSTTRLLCIAGEKLFIFT